MTVDQIFDEGRRVSKCFHLPYAELVVSFGTLRMMVAPSFYFDSVIALGLNDEVRMAADDGGAGK